MSTRPGRHLYGRKDWQVLRRAVFVRDGWRCKACGKGVRNPVCDHIKDHRGNLELFYDMANLATLCKPCHDHKTGRALTGREPLPVIGKDGYPVLVQ